MIVASQLETDREQLRSAEWPPASARSVVISMNPRAGARCRREAIRGIESALANRGYGVRTTAELTELKQVTSEGRASGELRAVVAIGGDGTASVVRNHVPLDVPLVVVPMGTENLLGRYLGQGTTPPDVCRTLDDGVVVGLDLGRAGDKYFLLMLSAGFDAEVIRVLHEARQGNIRRSAYVWPVLRAMQSYAYPQIEVHCEADSLAGGTPLRCRWLFGFNLPLYALGLPIAPGAVATDGLLDLCAFERGTAWGVVRYLWHVKRGGHLNLADAAMLQLRRFRLESPEAANVAYQTDGDIGGVLPVDVEVLPGQLRLLVSRETAERLKFNVPVVAS